jgi:hypothetical protein
VGPDGLDWTTYASFPAFRISTSNVKMAISIVLRVSGRSYLKHPNAGAETQDTESRSRDSIAEAGYSKPEVSVGHGMDESCI